ncbi:hypothetical protein Tco_0127374 [Tanacetum coccineum]
MESPHYYPNSKNATAHRAKKKHVASHLEALHQSLVSSEDSNKTDLLYLGSGRGRREVYSIGWEEKNKTRIHALIVTARVPKQRNRVRMQKAHHKGTSSRKPADIRRAKTAKGVTGSPNQKGIGQIPTRMISPSLRRVENGRNHFHTNPEI